MEAHAPTPMHLRRDALQGATHLMQAIDALGASPPTPAPRWATHSGREPNSRNVIPGRVTFSPDLRAATADELARMEAGMREAAARIARERRLEVAIEQTVEFPPPRSHRNAARRCATARASDSRTWNW